MTFSGSNGECSKAVGRAPDQLPQLANNWANIMLDNSFPCAGWIVSVDYFRAVAEGTAFFGVWRAVGELEFELKYKLALPPTSPEVRHRVFADVPFRVARGDLIGIHYSVDAPHNRRNPRIRSAIIPHAESGDRDINDRELFSTYNARVFDEDVRLRTPIDLRRGYSGEIVRRTFALRANLVYEDPGTGRIGAWNDSGYHGNQRVGWAESRLVKTQHRGHPRAHVWEKVRSASPWMRQALLFVWRIKELLCPQKFFCKCSLVQGRNRQPRLHLTKTKYQGHFLTEMDACSRQATWVGTSGVVE